MPLKKPLAKPPGWPVAKPAQWGCNDEEDHNEDNPLQAPTALSCKSFANSAVKWHVNRGARQCIAKNWHDKNWNKRIHAIAHDGRTTKDWSLL